MSVMTFSECKLLANSRLEQAAGRPLTPTELFEWWNENDRYLAILDAEKRPIIAAEARTFRVQP
jgi:hypothetical protein